MAAIDPSVDAMTTTATVLDRRALNRATLARQFLLERTTRPVTDVVEHLGGLQAQTAKTWYTGLFSRIADYDPEETGRLVEDASLVRITLMRGTIHLVTLRDAYRFRPLHQAMIERVTDGAFGRNLRDLDRDTVVAAGVEVLETTPMMFSHLGRELVRRWPDRDPASLAQWVRAGAPLVQVPPRGVWGRSGQAKHAPLASWAPSGDDIAADAAAFGPADLVRRYLAAFGPASVMDIQTWCGLTKLAEVVDEMRAELMSFRDTDGRELVDLPDAARPDSDTPAPVRFLYDYDNLLLSHADRSRVAGGADYAGQGFTPENMVQPATVLVDGMAAATWRLEKAGSAATLTVRPFRPVTTAERDDVVAEGRRLSAFLAPGVAADAVDVVVTG